jgi:ElaA protein
MEFSVVCKTFHELTPTELYDLLRLRSEVFVVEQKCIFLDLDNKDKFCDHVLISSNEIVATSRLVPPGISYPEMSIGRVVTHHSVRKSGVGNLLMDVSIDLMHKKFGSAPIKIGAQLYLKKFYEGFRFQQCSEIYEEDGIDHILMIRP